MKQKLVMLYSIIGICLLLSGCAKNTSNDTLAEDVNKFTT